jgi:hypothetical protein
LAEYLLFRNLFNGHKREEFEYINKKNLFITKGQKKKNSNKINNEKSTKNLGKWEN